MAKPTFLELLTGYWRVQVRRRWRRIRGLQPGMYESNLAWHSRMIATLRADLENG